MGFNKAREIKRGILTDDIVSLTNVSFGYDKRNLVIENLNLKIGRGEFLTILGPSGCGKSTVLNLIAGFIKPTVGIVSHDGVEVKKPSVSRGVIFQGNALFDWMTIQQNIAFGLRFQSLSRKEKEYRVRSIVELVGLTSSINKYPYQLSGGMKQRVAVARSMVIQPEILLMDEPFAAVDVQTREGLQEELLKLREQIQGTILLVTHSIDEAIFLSDRIIILSQRKIDCQFEIDLPSPRYSSMNRISKKFNTYRSQIYTQMKKIS